MTAERFNKLKNTNVQVEYLVENLKISGFSDPKEQRFKVHRLHGFYVVVVKDQKGDVQEVIGFDKLNDALNFACFRRLSVFS